LKEKTLVEYKKEEKRKRFKRRVNREQGRMKFFRRNSSIHKS
jgi:hypothetical protein